MDASGSRRTISASCKARGRSCSRSPWRSSPPCTGSTSSTLRSRCRPARRPRRAFRLIWRYAPRCMICASGRRARLRIIVRCVTPVGDRILVAGVADAGANGASWPKANRKGTGSSHPPRPQRGRLLIRHAPNLIALSKASLALTRLAFDRLTDLIPHEAADDDVLAHLRNLARDVILHRLVGILDERLFEQAHGRVILVDLPLDDFLDDVRRLADDLAGGDVTLLDERGGRHLLAADANRARGRDVQRDVLHEIAKVVVLRHEVGLAIHLDEHADAALDVNV